MRRVPTMRAAVRLLLALSMAVGGQAALAFDRSDGVQVQCEVERNGERRVVQEIWTGHGDAGERHPELGGAAAVVRPGPDGWPIIYFDTVTIRSFQQNEPYMLDFIFYHECAHAADPARTEVEANCEAFLALDRLGLMDAAKEAAIAGTHRKWRRLPSRYGGSGPAFWDQTMACVDARRSQAARSTPDDAR